MGGGAVTAQCILSCAKQRARLNLVTKLSFPNGIPEKLFLNAHCHWRHLSSLCPVQWWLSNHMHTRIVMFTESASLVPLWLTDAHNDRRLPCSMVLSSSNVIQINKRASPGNQPVCQTLISCAAIKLTLLAFSCDIGNAALTGHCQPCPVRGYALLSRASQRLWATSVSLDRNLDSLDSYL